MPGISGALKAVGKAIGVRKGKKIMAHPPMESVSRRAPPELARAPSRRFLEPTEPVPDWKTLPVTEGVGEMLDTFGYEGGADYEELRKTMPSDEAMEAFIRYRETGNVMNREAVKQLLPPGIVGNAAMAASFVRYEKDDRARRIASVMTRNIANTVDDIDFLCAGELSSKAIMPMVRQVSEGDPLVGGMFAVAAYNKKLSVLGFLLYEKKGKEMHIQFLCASKEQELVAEGDLKAATFQRIGSTLMSMAKKDWADKVGPGAVITLDSVPGATGFYEKMGFKATGPKNFEDNLPMEWRP